jgi:hypothetical protein
MTQNGDKAVLNACVAQSVFYRVRLFKNNYTPLVTSVIGDFTEADFDGYSGYQAPTFVAAVINGSGKGIIIAGGLLWLCTGVATPNTIYGYYVTEGTDAIAVYAERFAASISIAAPGDFVVVTPTVTAVTE